MLPLILRIFYEAFKHFPVTSNRLLSWKAFFDLLDNTFNNLLFVFLIGDVERFRMRENIS